MKYKIISIRLNENELQDFTSRAKIAQMPISSFLKKSAKESIIKPKKDLAPILTELKRIGNNLNQIAKKNNAGFYEIDRLMDLLQMIDYDLDKLVEKI